MWEPGVNDEGGMPDRWWASPLSWAAGAWVIGLILGRQLGGSWEIWLTTGVLLIGAGLLLIRLSRGGVACGAVMVGVMLIAAGWWDARVGPGGVWGLVAHPVSRLASVEGVVEDEIYTRAETRGSFGRFDYRGPSTAFVLVADHTYDSDSKQWLPMHARIGVGGPDFDDRLRPGDRVRCTGWLSSVPPPANPGEHDRRTHLRDQGMIGHLALRTRGNCTLLEHTEDRRGVAADLHDGLTAGAMWALRHGFDAHEQRPTLDLLEVLLLGDWRGELEDTRAVFRRSGLTHVLAISGLHLAILMTGAWWALLMTTGRPRIAAIGALALVGLYLLIVPPGVSILRSGLMAAVACAAIMLGRRVSPMAAMCGAALLLLIVGPRDLLSPGFQLSFGVVAALLIGGSRVRDWLAPPPLVDDGLRPLNVRRWVAGYLAVNLVAWCASAPLIAFHFGAVVPAGLFSTLLTLPLVSLLLWVGYTKIVLTGLWPWAGGLLAEPLGLLAEAMGNVAAWAASWPGAMIQVPYPTLGWTMATMLVVAAILAGWMANRRRLALLAAALCLVWPFLPPATALIATPPDPVLRVHMLAVGHGSCYLLRSHGHTLMYDCGSSDYLDITTVTVAPALKALGVGRVDTLILSHPDLDHYSGTLEAVDSLGINRVLLSEGFRAERERAPHGPAAFLLEQLEARGVQLETVDAGWRETFGGAQVRALWPPPDARFKKQNDGSIVLAVEAAGRRLLLTGDIQKEAMDQMMARYTAGELDSDVMELPHHGSMVDCSPGFLDAVSPQIVLQSASASQLRSDRWPEHLHGATRYITARDGAVEVVIAADGTATHRPFRDEPWQLSIEGGYDATTPPMEADR